jgi:hypothetical protein
MPADKPCPVAVENESPAELTPTPSSFPQAREQLHQIARLGVLVKLGANQPIPSRFNSI